MTDSRPMSHRNAQRYTRAGTIANKHNALGLQMISGRQLIDRRLQSSQDLSFNQIPSLSERRITNNLQEVMNNQDNPSDEDCSDDFHNPQTDIFKRHFPFPKQKKHFKPTQAWQNPQSISNVMSTSRTANQKGTITSEKLSQLQSNRFRPLTARTGPSDNPCSISAYNNLRRSQIAETTIQPDQKQLYVQTSQNALEKWRSQPKQSNEFKEMGKRIRPDQCSSVGDNEDDLSSQSLCSDELRKQQSSQQMKAVKRGGSNLRQSGLRKKEDNKDSLSSRLSQKFRGIEDKLAVVVQRDPKNPLKRQATYLNKIGNIKPGGKLVVPVTKLTKPKPKLLRKQSSVLDYEKLAEEIMTANDDEDDEDSCLGKKSSKVPRDSESSKKPSSSLKRSRTTVGQKKNIQIVENLQKRQEQLLLEQLSKKRQSLCKDVNLENILIKKQLQGEQNLFDVLLKENKKKDLADMNIEEGIQNIAYQMRCIQGIYNQIVSEGNEIHELPLSKAEVKVDIKAMGSQQFSLSVKGKIGPIRINFNFPTRSETDDFSGFLSIEKDIVSNEDKSCFFKFHAKKNLIVLYPQSLPAQAFVKKDDDYGANGNVDKNKWPLQTIYLQLLSSSGCQFSMQAVVIKDEQFALKQAAQKSAEPNALSTSRMRKQVKAKISTVAPKPADDKVCGKCGELTKICGKCEYLADLRYALNKCSHEEHMLKKKYKDTFPKTQTYLTSTQLGNAENYLSLQGYGQGCSMTQNKTVREPISQADDIAMHQSDDQEASEEPHGHQHSMTVDQYEEALKQWQELMVQKQFLLQEKNVDSQKQAKFKRDFITQNSHKYRVFNLIKWSLLKQHRLDLEATVEKETEKQQMITKWLIQMFARNFIAQVYRKHKNQVNIVLAAKMFTVKIQKIVQVQLRYIKKKGCGRTALHMRIRNSLSSAFTFVNHSDQFRTKANKTVAQFIQDGLIQRRTIRRIEVFIESTIRIQRTYRNMKENIKHRRQALSDQFDIMHTLVSTNLKVYAKKNKKFKVDIEPYHREINTSLRDLLVTEFVQNVCQRYAKLLAMVHQETVKVRQQLQLVKRNQNIQKHGYSDDSSDDQFEMPEQVYLPQEPSSRVWSEIARINLSLQNCQSGNAQLAGLKLGFGFNMVKEQEATSADLLNVVSKKQFLMKDIELFTNYKEQTDLRKQQAQNQPPPLPSGASKKACLKQKQAQEAYLASLPQKPVIEPLYEVKRFFTQCPHMMRSIAPKQTILKIVWKYHALVDQYVDAETGISKPLEQFNPDMHFYQHSQQAVTLSTSI